MSELPHKRLRAAWANSMPIVCAAVSWYITAVAMDNGASVGLGLTFGLVAAAVVGVASIVAYRLYLRRLVNQARRARVEAS
jgi:hypothetical protein